MITLYIIGGYQWMSMITFYFFVLKWPFYTRTRNDENSYYYSCRIESSIEINKNYYVVRNAGCARSRYTLKLSFIFLNQSMNQ